MYQRKDIRLRYPSRCVRPHEWKPPSISSQAVSSRLSHLPSPFILTARLREPRWASKRQNKYAIHASPSRPPWNVHNPQTKTRKEVRDRVEDRGIFGGVEVGEKISTNYRRRVFWSAYTTATRMLILKTLISIWKTRREANSDCLPHPRNFPSSLPHFRFAADILPKSGYFQCKEKTLVYHSAKSSEKSLRICPFIFFYFAAFLDITKEWKNKRSLLWIYCLNWVSMHLYILSCMF